MGEEPLLDISISFGVSGKTIRHNSFVLCLFSPVFRRMVCGPFRESTERRIQLEAKEETPFRQAMDLACGRMDTVARDMKELVELAAFADRFEMSWVAQKAATAVQNHITAETCAEVLRYPNCPPLVRTVEFARKMARDKFGDFVKSAGFVHVPEDVICGLLADDRLLAEEVSILEAAVEWIIKGGGGDEGERGAALLREVRYGLLPSSTLSSLCSAGACLPEKAQGPVAPALLTLPAHHLVLMNEAARQALVLQQAPMWQRARVAAPALGSKAFHRRLQADADCKNIDWWAHAHGGRRHRLPRGEKNFCAVVAGGGCAYGGRRDGSIVVWDCATLSTLKTLKCSAEEGRVLCMALWGDNLLVTAHHHRGMPSVGWGSGLRLLVWDARTGACQYVLLPEQYRSYTFDPFDFYDGSHHDECGEVSLGVWEHHLLVAQGDMVSIWDLRALPPPGSLVTRVSSDDSTTSQMECASVWTILKHRILHAECASGDHAAKIRSMAVWEGKVALALEWSLVNVYKARRGVILDESGATADRIRIYDVATGDFEVAIGVEHDDPVSHLTVAGGALVSLDEGGEMRFWALGNWDAVEPLPVDPSESLLDGEGAASHKSDQSQEQALERFEQVVDDGTVNCISGCGTKVLVGLQFGLREGLLVVIDVATRRVEHRLVLAHELRQLSCTQGQAWGLLGVAAAVWGKT